MFKRLITALFLVALPVIASPVLAQEALLTVETPAGKTSYTREAFEALGTSGFSTSTIWTKGVQKFEGVALAKVLAENKIESGTLTLVAANEYQISMPVAEVLGAQALLATTRNGEVMNLRDKGPLWMVFPYDSTNPIVMRWSIRARSGSLCVSFKPLDPFVSRCSSPAAA